MLKTANLSDISSTNRLVRIWTLRYLPQLSCLPLQDDCFPAAELIKTATLAGRTKTIENIRRFLQINCEMAGLETDSLYSYIPNIIQLSETRRIAQAVKQVYEKILIIYQQQPPPSHFLQFIDKSFTLFSKLALPALMLPTITQLVDDVEPILLHLQHQHLNLQDTRTIGFLTTHFHFSNREILKQLTLHEQILITPYFKFVEEQVCIPWKRVCVAAAQHSVSSPTFVLVERLLTDCHSIAECVYNQSLQLYPTHRSRRGKLNTPEVAVSTLRDLNMIQGYLLLCVLENSMTAIEKELLPLCVMVFPSIDVKWELVEAMLALLMQEMLNRITIEQKTLLRPYIQATQQCFATQNLHNLAACQEHQ